MTVGELRQLLNTIKPDTPVQIGYDGIAMEPLTEVNTRDGAVVLWAWPGSQLT